MVNAVFLLAVLFLPTLLGFAALGIWRFAHVIWQRTHQRQVPVTLNQPIERIAADLRRLRREFAIHQAQSPGPGRSVRSRALTAAYVDVLAAACRALEVPPPHVPHPGRMPTGEIRRVESELCRRGLDLCLDQSH